MNPANRGWVAMHRGEVVDTLQEKHPSAFLLLCQIARRARVTPCLINKLSKGEALIGDFKRAGLSSERIYRTAKKQLEEFELATFKATSKGTIAKLINTNVFSVTIDKSDEHIDKQPTGSRQTSADRVTTKNNVNKENKENKETHDQPVEKIVCDHLVRKINSLRSDWEKPWTEYDYEPFLYDFNKKLEQEMSQLTDDEWTKIRKYLAHTPSSAGKYWQPELRHKFISSFPSVYRQAAEWGQMSWKI